jgi:hypothetical protein
MKCMTLAGPLESIRRNVSHLCNTSNESKRKQNANAHRANEVNAKH